MILVTEMPLLIRTLIPCWKCRTKIPVVAIAVSKFKDHHMECNFPTFFEFVREMPEDLKLKIQEYCPEYHFSYSYMAQISYFANHCGRCRSLQGDFFLHQELNSPFVPDSANQVSRFEIFPLHIPLPFQLECEYGTGGDDVFWQRLGLKGLVEDNKTTERSTRPKGPRITI